MATGVDTIDFGAFPGSLYTTKVITGQAAIVTGSIVQAEIRPILTADHTADEHIVDPPDFVAADIVAGTGFTVHSKSNNQYRHHGLYNFFWAWI